MSQTHTLPVLLLLTADRHWFYDVSVYVVLHALLPCMQLKKAAKRLSKGFQLIRTHLHGYHSSMTALTRALCFPATCLRRWVYTCHRMPPDGQSFRDSVIC